MLILQQVSCWIAEQECCLSLLDVGHNAILWSIRPAQAIFASSFPGTPIYMGLQEVVWVTWCWLCPSASAPAGGEGFGFGAKHVVVGAGLALVSQGRRPVPGEAFLGRRAVGWCPPPEVLRMRLPTRKPEAPKNDVPIGIEQRAREVSQLVIPVTCFSIKAMAYGDSPSLLELAPGRPSLQCTPLPGISPRMILLRRQGCSRSQACVRAEFADSAAVTSADNLLTLPRRMARVVGMEKPTDLERAKGLEPSITSLGRSYRRQYSMLAQGLVAVDAGSTGPNPATAGTL